MLKYTFLTDAFYQDYADYPEIEQKRFRPHVLLKIVVDGVTWCIPLRSHISHPHAYLTDPKNHCGVDFSKAVAITDPRYLDAVHKPVLRQNEFDALRGKDYLIRQRFQAYIRAYIKAKSRLDVPRNRTLVQMSTLQYFEEYLS